MRSAVVVNGHSDPTIWILDANPHRGCFREPHDIGNGFLDDAGDLAQHAARDLQVVALLCPRESAVHGSQHGFGVAARLLQRPDAALEMPDAIRERARAIHGPTSGTLQVPKVLGPGCSLRYCAANLYQEGAQRPANPIIHFARESLPFDGQLALPATFRLAFILEPAGDPQNVGDPAGDELEDRDPFRRHWLTARAPLLTDNQHSLRPRAGEEGQDCPDLRRRREERAPFRCDRRVELTEVEHDGMSIPERPGTTAKPGDAPGRRSYPARRPMTSPSSNRECPF